MGGVLGTNGWDRERNLDAARALGMQAVRYADADRLRTDLAALDVVF